MVRYPGFRGPGIRVNDICEGFDIPEFESRDAFDAAEFESHDICEGFDSFDIPEFESHDVCEGFDSFDIPEFESHDVCEVFEAPEFESHDICEGFDIPEFESHDICEVFEAPELESHVICEGFDTPEFERHDICEVFEAPEFESHDICEGFETFEPHDISTEAPGVPDYKNRLSSHGSSGCPQRTTSVLQKSTFQPRKLRTSAAYYMCTTKVDFPATEVPGVLRLYYKVDFPATVGVLQRRILRAQQNAPALHSTTFCTTKDVFGDK